MSDVRPFVLVVTWTITGTARTLRETAEYRRYTLRSSAQTAGRRLVASDLPPRAESFTVWRAEDWDAATALTDD